MYQSEGFYQSLTVKFIHKFIDKFLGTQADQIKFPFSFWIHIVTFHIFPFSFGFMLAYHIFFALLHQLENSLILASIQPKTIFVFTVF